MILLSHIIKRLGWMWWSILEVATSRKWYPMSVKRLNTKNIVSFIDVFSPFTCITSSRFRSHNVTGIRDWRCGRVSQWACFIPWTTSGARACVQKRGWKIVQFRAFHRPENFTLNVGCRGFVARAGAHHRSRAHRYQLHKDFNPQTQLRDARTG